VRAIPGPGGVLPTANTPVVLVFDELLDPSTVNTANIAAQLVGGGAVPRIVDYAETVTQGMVTLFLPPTITPGGVYRVRVSGVGDKKGNVIPTANPLIWEFTVAPETYSFQVLDSLFSSDAAWGRADSGSTGYVYASFVPDVKKAPGISGNLGSGKVTVGWDTVANPSLVQVPVLAGQAIGTIWGKTNHVLQVYLYGDGSKAQFRFCVEDSVDAPSPHSPLNREVSTWRTIDWAGWRMVSWDLDRDSVGTWIGNGSIGGKFKFSSFQFRYVPGLTGSLTTVYLDQLQIAERVVVSVDPVQSTVPGQFALEQNYPNPFNGISNIGFRISELSNVKLRVYDLLGREVALLVDGQLPVGSYSVRFDAGGLASGMYVVRMTAGDFVASKKMVLAR
jgi:hypothetical protein